jgi:F0F1-type ATP synthase membrane subunit c/vacuolar-type H+-ATPase subunit K
MLVGFAEGLGAAKTYSTRNHYEIDANRELLGLGAANLGAALCTGMVVNGSLSKTAVNVSSGAKSQLSGLVVAAMTVITLLFLTGLFEDLPAATLAAVVIAAMLGVLVFDTLPGLFIGIAVSLLRLLYRASRPHVAELGKVPGRAPTSSPTATATRRTSPRPVWSWCRRERAVRVPHRAGRHGRASRRGVTRTCHTGRWRNGPAHKCAVCRALPMALCGALPRPALPGVDTATRTRPRSWRVRSFARITLPGDPLRAELSSAGTNRTASRPRVSEIVIDGQPDGGEAAPLALEPVEVVGSLQHRAGSLVH